MSTATTGRETEDDSVMPTSTQTATRTTPAPAPSTPTRPAPPQPAAPAPAPAAPASGNSWIGPLCVLIVGMFMSVLDTSIVNIAIPKMQTALNASVDNIEWVVTGYTLALGVVVPLTGWLGLRIGQTRLYILSMLGFTLGSALCGFAWNLTTMIAFRVIQAIPGGILPVVTMTILFRIVPRDKIGQAMGIYGLGVVVAPAIGPTLGGALVDTSTGGYLLHQRAGRHRRHDPRDHVLPPDRVDDVAELDILGFVTSRTHCSRCSSPSRRVRTGAGPATGSWGVRHLRASSACRDHRERGRQPAHRPQGLPVAAFSISLALLGVTITGLFSGLYFLPQFLQQVQGLEELDSGLVLLPGSLVLLVMMPLAGSSTTCSGPGTRS